MGNLKTKFSILLFTVFNLLYKINFSLYKLFYFLYKNGEKKEINFFKSRIKEGMTVVDVGANIGFYTLLFSNLVGETGKVFAFEPDKRNYSNLKKICGNLGNVVLIESAVGDTNKTINLYKSDNLNVDHVTYKNSENRKSYPVKCLTLDKYFEKTIVDFVKIDTQGYELQVLQGMRSLVRKNKGICIYCEFQKIYLKRAGTSIKEFLNFFVQNRLKTKYLWEGRPERLTDDRIIHADIIATRS